MAKANRMANEREQVVYTGANGVKINALADVNTVWLNRQQLAVLFGRDVKTIGKHIANALKEELLGMATVAKFATVQTEGERTVTRQDAWRHGAHERRQVRRGEDADRRDDVRPRRGGRRHERRQVHLERGGRPPGGLQGRRPGEGEGGEVGAWCLVPSAGAEATKE